MLKFPALARDVTCHPKGTRLEGVRVASENSTAWLREMPVCAVLAERQILHTGQMYATPGYRIVRTCQKVSYFFATLSGQGRVLVNGRWQPCRPGTGCLLPPYILESFEQVGQEPWVFVWVCYQQPRHQWPIAGATSPLLGRFDVAPLQHAIAGLLAECRGAASPALQHHSVELIHGNVVRFANPLPRDDSFMLAWEQVAKTLAKPWTLSSLAAAAHCSREQLRQRSLEMFGRSPMQQLTHLRMQRAAELLASSDDKLQVVAAHVGYDNPFAFSNAFQRWTGLRPSHFRAKRGLRS